MLKYWRFILCFLLTTQLLPAFDSSHYGNTLPTLKELQCFADKGPKLLGESKKLEVENAYIFGILSGLAYYNATDAAPVAKALGFTKVELIEATKDFIPFNDLSNFVIAHTTALWLENDSDVVIAFGGTNPKDIRNFITDGQIRPQPFDTYGKVHPGFRNALNIVWDQIESKVKALQASGAKKNIHLTGHSLGAALATLASVRIMGKLKYPFLRNLYTFGSPHVGDQDFIKAFNGFFKDNMRLVTPNTFRFVHQWDVVTRLLEVTSLSTFESFPPYKQVDNFVFLNGEGKLFEGQAALGAYSYWGDPTKGIQHHDIRFYTEYSYRLWSAQADSGCL